MASPKERENYVYTTKLAERYDEMVEAMTKVAILERQRERERGGGEEIAEGRKEGRWGRRRWDHGLQWYSSSWLKKKLPAGFGISMKSRSFSLSPATSLASAESLSMPLLQEVVLSADVSCSDCQKRLSDIMSKMGEVESVVVNVSEKRVMLVCRYPGAAKVPSTRLVPAVYKKPLNKFSLIRRMLRSSSS